MAHDEYWHDTVAKKLTEKLTAELPPNVLPLDQEYEALLADFCGTVVKSQLYFGFPMWRPN